MNQVRYWADRFDRQAQSYPEDAVKALNFSNERLMNQVHASVLSGIDLSVLAGGDRVLDTGCGTGLLLCRLIKACREHALCRYHATDISREMLKKTRENVSLLFSPSSLENCRYFQMSVDKMGFGKKTFSLVLACESLQYTDPYHALSGLIKMTKKGGQVAVSIPNARSGHILNAVKKHQGRFTGLEYDQLVEKIGPLVSSLRIKPLIFAEDQTKNPYLDKPFQVNPDQEDILAANRFVLHIRV